jgi:hypothetical protein
MNEALYEQFKELLTGNELSTEQKEELSRKILEIIFGEQE